MKHTIFYFNNLIRNRRATTLLEIITALIIMALTFIPIITSIGKSTKDTDIANSYVFAQTQARNILDTLLDDVPFNCINGSGDIGTLSKFGKYNLDPFKQMIGISGDKMDGTIKDERGVHYNIRIYVQSIADNDLYFAYLPRPRFEIASKTTSSGEIDQIWYHFPASNDSDEKRIAAFLKSGAPDPYELNTSFYVVATQTKRISDLWHGYVGTVPPVLKKILLQVEWKAKDNKTRSFELYTMKANLDDQG